MVGMEDPVGGTTPPGEGRSGAMSGDNSWKGDRGGGFVKNDGVAAIVKALILIWEDKESNGEAMKAMMSAKWNQKEAILMMKKSISGLLQYKIYLGKANWGKAERERERESRAIWGLVEDMIWGL